MKKCLLLVLVAALCGCKSDDAKSLSRNYRNLHNEALDALMFINGEPRAKFAKDKIFDPFSERLSAIDKKMATWLQNTEDDEILRDTLTSDSVPLLLAECAINLRRLEEEKQRLGRLIAAKAQDDGIAVADVGKVWPNVVEFARGSPMTQLKMNLEKGTKFGELRTKISTDPAWKKKQPPDFGKLWEAFMDRLKDQEKPQGG